MTGDKYISLKEQLASKLGSDAALAEGFYPQDVPVYRVARDKFRDAARSLKAADARLVAEWASDETQFERGFGVYACFAKGPEYLIVKTEAPLDDPEFPSLTKKYTASYRFERQIKSLMGVVPEGHPDPRPWIKHEDWPEGAHPLRKAFDPKAHMPRVEGSYNWIKADGEEIHEIGVGPVHAGIIEPGHFRFLAAGEDIINLEERLGYVHKGIEKRFEELSWKEAAVLAGRVSGDTTVAHALGYSMALESMTGCEVPKRGQWLRALFLERERIANHLGDIGAICNDTAFAFLLYQFSRLKENMMRTNGKLFGHRFMMDRVVPGGVAVDIAKDGVDEILAELEGLSAEFERLVPIYEDNPSLEDRVYTAGILKPETAKDLGVVGFVARSSGQALDCRLQRPFPPYDTIVPKVTLLSSGDVHARAWVRIEEVRDSIRIIRGILDTLPAGPVLTEFNEPLPGAAGFSAVEGWRGEIIYWIEAGRGERPNGRPGGINRCMVRDPSSVNWLALEQAIKGNIVPDFPLCNKSFNQSYSGNDL